MIYEDSKMLTIKALLFVNAAKIHCIWPETRERHLMKQKTALKHQQLVYCNIFRKYSILWQKISLTIRVLNVNRNVAITPSSYER